MLYNAHLETFIRVVESGSFRGASELIGISPSAVLKQISLLEKDIGVPVFERNRKGVTLTEAGESVYQDARYIARYCEDAERRARELGERQSDVIRIGVSPMTPGDDLTELWGRIHGRCEDLQLRLNPFENTRVGVERAFQRIGHDADIIVGPYDDIYLNRYNVNALKLREIPVVAAFSLGHPLNEVAGRKGSLDLEDLEPYIIRFPKGPYLKTFIGIKTELRTRCPEVVTEEFDVFSLDAFYGIQNSSKVLMTFDLWKMSHAFLQFYPVNWRYSSSYGIMYAKEPSDKVKRLLTVVGKVSGSN